MPLNHGTGWLPEWSKRRGLALGLAVVAAGVAFGGVARSPEPGDTGNEVALEATVERPAELSATERARLESKVKRGKKPYDQPAEAARFFLFQRMPLDLADKAHLEDAQGKIPRIDQVVPVSADGYYEALSDAQEHIRQMPRATFEPEGIVVHSPEEPAPEAEKALTNWTELGPGNISGRTRAILIVPGTPNMMYAAGVAGGVWKTTNGGASWTALDDLMDNLAVCTLAFAGQGGTSLNTSIIYAGTGEGLFNHDAVRGAGIFKSTDAGATWVRLVSTSTSDFYYVNKIVPSPSSASVLYAATRTGVWKTVDAGTTWQKVLGNDGGGLTANTTVSVLKTAGGFTDLEIRTDLVPDYLVTSNGSFSTDGIYVSDDAGATWDRTHSVASLGRSDLAIAPSNQNTMYALSADSGGGHRLLNVYRSTDSGRNWSPRVTPPFNKAQAKWLLLSNPVIANNLACFADPESVNSQGWYDNIIAVDPTNENRVFAGGIDLFRSEDGGANWGLISYWWLDMADAEYAHADQHTIVFHPGYNGTTNQTVFVGNDGGIFQTTNAVSGAVASGTNPEESHSLWKEWMA